MKLAVNMVRYYAEERRLKRLELLIFFLDTVEREHLAAREYASIDERFAFLVQTYWLDGLSLVVKTQFIVDTHINNLRINKKERAR